MYDDFYDDDSWDTRSSDESSDEEIEFSEETSIVVYSAPHLPDLDSL